MKREELPPHKTATFVLPRWRTVYVSIPKAACTSLKWLIADLQEESREHFYATLSPEVTRSLTVHRRSRWRHTPTLHELSDADLDPIRPDNGWFVFSVVRHPAARLWSAWQSKLLLKDPRFVALYPDAAWPRVPGRSAEVVEDFQKFARSLAAEPKQPIFGDRHFRRQVELVRSDRTPYSRIYQTSQMPQLLSDLEEHLLALGLDRLPELLRSNETPLRPLNSAFTGEVLEVIGQHFHADFEEFGYADLTPPDLDKDSHYASGSLAEISRLVERSERIGDLHAMAVRWRRTSRTSGGARAALGSEQNHHEATTSFAQRLRARTQRLVAARGQGRPRNR
jgi:Sulfotransferase family